MTDYKRTTPSPFQDDPQTTPLADESDMTQSLPPRTDAVLEPAPASNPDAATASSGEQGRPPRGQGDKVASKVEKTVVDAQDKLDDMTTDVRDKAQHLTDEAHTMSDKGIDSAAAGLGQAASVLRQQAEEREGAVGTAASKTAETLETASDYLQEKDTDQLMADLEELVRKRPVESVLVAAGIGFVLSKVFG